MFSKDVTELLLPTASSYYKLEVVTSNGTKHHTGKQNRLAVRLCRKGANKPRPKPPRAEIINWLNLEFTDKWKIKLACAIIIEQ